MPDEITPTRSNEARIYVSLILSAHFGVRNFPEGETVCAGCGMEVPWPCSPVLLARLVKEENAS
jgi:hypothetical protein